MRWMYDAAYPPKNPPHWHVAAGYIGGDTPHVWTKAEWDAQWSPRRLPIWTASNRSDDAGAAANDAGAILAKLRELGVPPGSSVALDTEMRIYTAYVAALNGLLGQHHYPLIQYGSLSVILKNPKTSGGRWSADWTGWAGDLHLDHGSGIVATQRASADQMGTKYDASVIEDVVPLWHAPGR
jgi:hypothetical protein